jgi:hypothetical protein
LNGDSGGQGITTTTTNSSTTTTTTKVTETTTTTLSTAATTTSTTLGNIEKIVFSEIQISGLTASDEFVELYNPSNNDVNLEGFSIKKLSSNNEENKSNLVSDDMFLGKVIRANEYFLIIPKVNGDEIKYTGSVSSDANYNSTSYFISDNNTLVLYDNYNRVVDTIGWSDGDILNPVCEDTCLENISNNQSFERKANKDSTLISMTEGTDKLKGNGYDSENNSFDFIVREDAGPQNSLSLTEPQENSGILKPTNVTASFDNDTYMVDIE